MVRTMKYMAVTLITALILGMGVFAVPEVQAAARPEIKISYKMISQTSVKIKWSGGKKLKYWRIRRSITKSNGEMGKYKTVKILKRSNKSYTINKLKKNKYYVFEITGGIKKKGKYKVTSMYEYIWPLYTGLSGASWDDYANSDAPYSPTCIELWGHCDNNGLPIKAIEIFRKRVGVSNSKYKKIASIKKKSFKYQDKKVVKGATYKYKMRTVGTYKKKKIYSKYSSIMTKSAVNQTGIYTCNFIEQDASHLVVRLTAKAYNAPLVIKGGYDYTGESYGDDCFSIKIEKWSQDGTNWTTASGKKTISGKQTIYLYLTYSYSEDLLDDLRRIDISHVEYDGWKCAALSLQDGLGMAYLIGEDIH